MFKRTEEEIIEIVGEALKNGNKMLKKHAQIGEMEYFSYSGILRICKKDEDMKSAQILTALLNHLGLEFKTERNVIIKKGGK